MQYIPLTTNYDLGSSSGEYVHIIPSAKSTLVNLCSFDLKPLTQSREVCRRLLGWKHTVKLVSAFKQYCMSCLNILKNILQYNIPYSIKFTMHNYGIKS